MSSKHFFSSYMYVKEPDFDKAGTKCVINSLTIIPSILNALSFPKPKKSTSSFGWYGTSIHAD